MLSKRYESTEVDRRSVDRSIKLIFIKPAKLKTNQKTWGWVWIWFWIEHSKIFYNIDIFNYNDNFTGLDIFFLIKVIFLCI